MNKFIFTLNTKTIKIVLFNIISRKIRQLGFLAFLFIGTTAFGQFYNGFQMDFGKNRIQYEEFPWTYYRFEKFDTYFYTGGKEVAIYTSKTAEQHLERIQDMFDYELSNRIQFVVYNKQSHFQQSNVGITADSESAIGGVTQIIGTKVFLYFNGNHTDLDKQIRAGLTEILINEMLFGGDWKEAIKNSALLTLPEWYKKGLISYASEPWNTQIENFVKDGVFSGRYKKFNQLTGEDALYAGHSMWNYIVDSYGSRVLSNVLYMTRISRNVESGFLFVLGASFSSLSDDWIKHYTKKYSYHENIRTIPDESKIKLRIKKSRIYSQLKISPDGTKVAYITNELGQYKIYIYNLEKRRKKLVYKEGHKLNRINDYSHILINWHPNGELLSIITEKKSKPFLLYYSLDTKKIEARPIFLLEKIISFDYSHDGKKMAFSAVLKGQSDIYIYNVGANTQEQITNDIFDDYDPKFINKSEEIIFSSNRTTDSLNITTENDIHDYAPETDLFIYRIKSKPNVLKRITNTPKINEIKPMPFDGDKFSYLSNENGVNNRFVARFDSTISFIDTSTHYRYYTTSNPHTNYKRGILEHHINPKTKKYTEIIYHKGKYQLHSESLNTNIPDSIVGFNTPVYFKEEENLSSDPSETLLHNDSINSNTITPETAIEIDLADSTYSSNKPKVVKTRPRLQTVRIENDKKIVDKEQVDINNYEFSQEENKQNNQNFADEVDLNAEKDSINQKTKDSIPEFKLPNQRNYNTIFYMDYIVSQLNNNFLSQSYQRFTGGGSPVYNNAGMNGVFKVGISDLFENKRIVGGVRLSPDLVNNEYYFSYEDLTHRFDRQYIYHRMSQTIIEDFTKTKIHTNEIKYVTKYPFSEVSSIIGTVNLRHDNLVKLSTEFNSLNEPNTNDYWTNIKLEYIFDNVLPKGVNIWYGNRLKIFGEFYKHLENKNSHIAILGLDFRKYIKIHRQFIWANRIASSTSFGPQKLIYYLGGVDGWIWPKFDNSISIDQNKNYVFQAVATNMRGYFQNTRNGQNFAVINSELRLPIFKYLMRKPIKSDFIRDFQIIGFGDIGSAWSGFNPYNDDNINTTIIYSNPFLIKLENRNQPIVYGYGAGLRSTLWGYFVRADWAWGIDNGIILPKVFYLSLNLDF